MEFILRFMYTGGNEELFDSLGEPPFLLLRVLQGSDCQKDFVQTPDDVVEFLFEVVDAAVCPVLSG